MQRSQNSRKTGEPKSIANKIAILTKSSNGYGDLVFAARLVKYLKNNLNNPIEIILLDSYTDLKRFQLLNIDSIVIYDINETDLNNYQIIIIGPGITDLTFFTKTKYLRNTNIILVSEYDYFDHFDILANTLDKELTCKKIFKIKSGLSNGCAGVLFEPDLLPDVENDCYTPQDSDWNNLSDDLKSILLNEKDRFTHYEKHLTSLAYCSFRVCGYVPLLHAAYAACFSDKSFYDLVMVSDNSSEMFYTKPRKYLKFLQHYLLPWGFTKITLVDMDKGSEVSYENKKNTIKEFRLLYCKHLSFKNMLALHKITGNHLSTVTGDQSLLEAISKGCMFFYLIFGVPHKLTLLSTLVNKAKVCNLPSLASLLSKFHHINPDDLISLVKLMYEAKHDFIQFCKYIRSTSNLGDKILSHIQECLAVSELSDYVSKHTPNTNYQPFLMAPKLSTSIQITTAIKLRRYIQGKSIIPFNENEMQIIKDGEFSEIFSLYKTLNRLPLTFISEEEKPLFNLLPFNTYGY